MLKTFLVPPFLAGHAPDLWSLEPETLTRGIFSCRAFSYIALMNMMIRDRRSELSRRLLDRLRPMVAGKLDVGMHPYGEQLFAYCCFDRERLAALRLDCPMICIVLHGQKDVWLGDRTRSFPAGSLFVLPGGVAMDVVNIPDDKTGVYAALRLDVPALRGFNFAGGTAMSPEFGALLIGLVVYTGTFIAEIVRAGILAVSWGQSEAAMSLGLTNGQRMRLVVLPQALRVIVPPMTSQYLNLTKNSSLAVIIGYPDLVSIANTTINQTGQAVEGITMIMAVYLAISLVISLLMNLYNRSVALVER